MPRIIKDTKTPTTQTQPQTQNQQTQEVFQSSGGITTYEWAVRKRGGLLSNLEVKRDAKEEEEEEKDTKTAGSIPTNRKWRRKKIKHADPGYNSGDEYCRPKVSEVDEDTVKLVSFATLSNCLKERLGYEIAVMDPDGNCLFRAVADQVYGDAELHDVVRMLCIKHMIRERDHFSQFVTEDFNQYIKRKKRMGVHGNHLELQAVSEIYSSPIEIYAVNDNPLNIFQGSYEANAVPIRLSYHYGLHYNSVRDLSTPRTFRPRPDISVTSEDVKRLLLESELSSINNLIVERTKKESEDIDIEQAIVTEALKDTESMTIEEDIIKQTAAEAEQLHMENDMLQQVLRETEQEALERQMIEQAMVGEYGNANQSELAQLQMALELSAMEASLSDF